MSICARSASALVALATLMSSAMADGQAVINLAGLKIKHATNQTKSSSPDTIDAGPRYSYVVDGMVKGDSGLLAVLYPSPTPLATILESFQPGSSEALAGAVNNLAAAHPVVLLDQTFSGTTVILSVTVNFSARFTVGIDAGNNAYFSLTSVVIDPSIIVGSMSFTSGTATIKRVACAADSNCDGFVNGDDFDLFATWFDTASPRGDFNRDGFVNGDDYDLFAEAFEAGC
ncbi:MAG: hypothetical protein IT434_15960 [Phycisphaerales bacterium]|jgi:hypothetical protein|nr:hypothetical protein [Phycisphaerales bacterium]